MVNKKTDDDCDDDDENNDQIRLDQIIIDLKGYTKGTSLHEVLPQTYITHNELPTSTGITNTKDEVIKLCQVMDGISPSSEETATVV